MVAAEKKIPLAVDSGSFPAWLGGDEHHLGKAMLGAVAVGDKEGGEAGNDGCQGHVVELGGGALRQGSGLGEGTTSTREVRR